MGRFYSRLSEVEWMQAEGILAIALAALFVTVLGCSSQPPPAKPTPTETGNLDLSPAAIGRDSNPTHDDVNEHAEASEPVVDVDRFEDETRYEINPDLFTAADDPRVVKASDAVDLSDDDEVLGFVVEGAPRAYSVRALSYHHVVNDAIAGVPIAVTY